LDSLELDDDQLRLNLSNAYFQINDTANSVNHYQSLTASSRNDVRSVAHQQLGIVDTQRKQYQEALQQFKESLKANPANEDARYNYELLKRLIEEQKKEQEQKQDQKKENQQKQDQQQEQQKNQDQKNKEQENQQEQENQEGEQKQEGESEQKKEGEEKDEKQGEEQDQDAEQQKDQIDPSTAEKLKEMNISEEKARMILEAMRNNEIQYLQQVKKKSKNPRRNNKPDW